MDADDVLRFRLSRTPQSVPAFRPQLDQVRKRARTRHRRRRAVAGASAAILLAGVGLPIWLLSGLGGPAPSHVLVSPSPGLHPVLVASIDLPGAVDLVVGEHSIWVAGFRVVSRVDPVSNEVVATVKTPGTEDYSHLAAGFGAVWVTADRGRVYRIDPNNDRVLATVEVGGSVQGIDTGGGYVWVTRPRGGAGDLIKIDPATNRVAGAPIKVGPGPVGVAYGFGALWITNTSPPSVVRVDSVTGSVTTLGFTGDVGVGPDSLWVASDNSVARVDPNTGAVIASIQIPRAQTVAVGEGRVWALATPRSSSPTLFYPIKHTAVLWEIDPATNRTVGRPVRLNALQPIALVVGGGAVWVADYNSGSVTHFGLER